MERINRMVRLPQPGGDQGNWGNILNEYLEQSHDPRGNLKDNVVTANTLAPHAVTTAALASDSVTAAIIADGTISETLLDSALQTRLNTPAPSATTSSVGLLQLAGDLSGTAQAPTVPGLVTKVSKGDLVFNVKDYGAQGNGTANDTAAINAAITAMPSIANTFGGVAGVLFFPAGRYLTDGGHTIPADKRMQVRGAGPYVSIIQQRSGATSDLITIKASNSGITALTLTGQRGGTPSDLLVLDVAYSYARNVTINSAAGNGITIGKTSSAIAHRLTEVNIRSCKGYGVQVISGSESTDGQWSNCDIGQSGLSGVRISNGAQNLFGVHVWGSGVESSTDKYGFWLDSSSNILIGCQSETNLGIGIHVGGTGSEGNVVNAAKVWGNLGAGIYGFSSHRHTITGSNIYNNGVNNTGSNTNSFAGIMNDGGVEWVVSGNNIYDDTKALQAGSYSGFTPGFTYPGRTAQATQSYAYAEGVNADFNSISGNVMRRERTRSGVSYNSVGVRNYWSGNTIGAMAIPVVASAASVTLPATNDFIFVSGAVAIISIAATVPGRRVTLRFTDAVPGGLVDGSNLKLAATFTPTQNDTISLACDGTDWYEITRSGDI
ncbi:TPA: right-handed parallel beta-helix repeat-containing protein [Candidatus Saccharibacteria bacterium]|nr:MAG: hypothetical protein A3E20_02485 [Candidatus Saccharibacteria bacterium RIFCSPHIGHO2_12_FULL_47_16]HBH77137.1 right-handed parallel beta-helix repeat-containing protein [Candidatus Saccharibacteria bacterium]